MRNILIIEDEKILAEMYKDKFTRVGFNVILASSAEKGISLAKEKKPDLIILDILLPRENGIDFLKKLKEDSEASSIPVIVLSNYNNSEAKKAAGELGVKDYLIKTNYTPQQIVEKIKEYLP